jgi:hypothetical protein
VLIAAFKSLWKQFTLTGGIIALCAGLSGMRKGASYNRDAFMLASLLITQISVDPTKINYPQQFLQVR